MSAPRERNNTRRKRQRTAASVDCHKETQLVQATSKMNSVAIRKDHSADEFSKPSVNNSISFNTPKASSIPCADNESSYRIPNASLASSSVNCHVPTASPQPNTDNRLSYSIAEASFLQPFNRPSIIIQPCEPTTASPAFNEASYTDDYTPSSMTSSLPSATTDIFSVALQPQSPSPVPDTGQTTHKTRYWELPDERRQDLALLSQFIKEQIDKKDKAKQHIDSSFGSTLKAIDDKTTMLNRDVMTLNEKLEATDKSIDNLISQTMEQRLEVDSASDVLQSRNMLGGSENGKLFENTTINMEKRINQLSETVSTLEQTVNNLKTNASFSPQLIGAVLNRQSRTFVSLAGCVANTHQEVAHQLGYHRSSN